MHIYMVYTYYDDGWETGPEHLHFMTASYTKAAEWRDNYQGSDVVDIRSAYVYDVK